MKRRAFLKGMLVIGAAAAAPAFIIRREPEPEPAFDFYTDRTADGVDRADVEKFDGESLFVPREGETWPNLCNPTPLNPENFKRVRQAMLDMRDLPPVIIVPPGTHAQWMELLAMPPGKVEWVRVG